MQTNTAAQPPAKPRPHKRWRWLGAIGGVIVALLLVAPFVAAPYVKRKLQRMVSDQLHAQLNISSLRYSFPYGVNVDDASFIAENPNDSHPGPVELLKVKHLTIALAELPFWGGPIVIENIAVDGPTIHIIRRSDGTYVGDNLARRGGDARESPGPMKLSDALRLRHFELNHATIIYEDRARPDARPLEWREIGARLELAQRSASSYGFQFAAQNEPLAKLDIAGTADVDSKNIAVEKLAMGVKVERDPPAGTSPLPPQLQEILRKLGVEGAVRFDARGDLPLLHPTQGTFIFNASLDNVQMRPPEQRWTLDRLSLNLEARKGDVGGAVATTQTTTTQSATHPVTQMTTQPVALPTTNPTTQPLNPDDISLKLSNVDAMGIGAKLELSEATGSIDLIGRTWKLDSVTGRVRAIEPPSTQPSTQPNTQPSTRAASEPTTRSSTQTSARSTTAPSTNASAASEPATRPVGIDRWVRDGEINFTASAIGVFADRVAHAAIVATQPASDDVPAPATGPFSPIKSGQLIATFNNLVLRPPDFPQPIEKFSGTVRMVDRAVLIDDFTATYGADQFLLKHALVPLDDVATRIDIVDIAAEAFFAQPGPAYPKLVAELMDVLHPAGAFNLTGAAAVYVGRGHAEPDYALRITPRASSVTLADTGIVVANIQGQINLVPKLIDVPYLEGESLSGAVALRGNLVPREPMTYDGQLSIQNADLSMLSQQLKLLRDDGRPKLTGRGMARVRASGEIPRGMTSQTSATQKRDAILASLKARGMARIEDGDLWSIKILEGIVGRIAIARDALTAGEAAAVFEVSGGTMHLRKAAISSTALGLQGTGDVNLRDETINLDIIVAPLGDWRKRIRETGIPILSQVAGELVGTLQKVVNTATSELLYEFRVTGKLADPKLSATPAPLLTEGAADLFGLMLKGTRSDKLNEAIGGNELDPGAVSKPK